MENDLYWDAIDAIYLKLKQREKKAWIAQGKPLDATWQKCCTDLKQQAQRIQDGEETMPDYVVKHISNRPELAKINGKRERFTGTVDSLGTKRGWQGRTLETVMLKDIKDASGKIVADHLWFNLTQGLRQAGCIVGVTLQFDARVEGYESGYFGHREDVYKPGGLSHKLSRPTKIVKIN